MRTVCVLVVVGGIDDVGMVGAIVVLTVAKVTAGGAAGYAEYLQGRSAAGQLGDYYLRDGEPVEAPGRWVSGAGAIGLNAGQAVTGQQLRSLLAVRDPSTGLVLRRAGGDGRAVAALDATFSAPKSVSAVWALGDHGLRERIEAAHERAVDRALAYATAHVQMIRVRDEAGAVVHARAQELLATSWRHTTARAVDGRPPDPQLHSHVLLHGAIRADRKVVAIDSRSWLVSRREIAAAYRCELARELAGLGFEIRRGTGRGGRYFEIDGVPAALIDRWSGRHHQVQSAITARLAQQRSALEQLVASGVPDAGDAARRLEALERSGRLGAAQDRLLTAVTRSPKSGLVTRGDVDRHWADAGVDAGLSRDDVRVLTGAPRAPEPASDAVLLDRLTEFDATFTSRELRAVALEASAGAGIDRALAGAGSLQGTGELLALADGSQTTRRHRHTERETVAAARRLTNGHVKPVSPAVVSEQVARLDRELRAGGKGLSLEQRDAIELACSDAQLVVIEGQAGTGKSTVLGAVARAHQTEGRKVIATSTAALAAQRLAADLDNAGVTATAYSTSALHSAIGNDRVVLGADTVIIHDEAALASTREQQRLLSAVSDSGARLIEVGDGSQSQPVGAGGLWHHLTDAARDRFAHTALTDNVRALDPADRADQAAFRAGEHETAIDGYAARARVTITSRQPDAEDRALEAAQSDRATGLRTIVIAQTSNDHLDQLNARAQAIRHEHHPPGNQGVPVAGRPYRLHAGDPVQVRHAITHPDSGVIQNGQSGRVTATDPERDTIAVDLGAGRHATLDREQLDSADLRLAYVAHPFPAQGQTTDTAHLIASAHATREGTYVAITRARQQTRIYSSHQQLNSPQPLQALAAQVSRTEPELASIDTPLAHEARIVKDEARELGDRDAGRETERATPTMAPDSTSQARAWPAREPERTIDDDAPGWEP
ncbi:MAG: MobF family relaxase [Solirubrobacteraceae bacterium]